MEAEESAMEAAEVAAVGVGVAAAVLAAAVTAFLSPQQKRKARMSRRWRSHHGRKARSNMKIMAPTLKI
jgi:hypothetical protein